MRLAGLAAFAVSLAAAGSAHGSAAQFKSLPHFKYDLHEFFVGTDKSWVNAEEVFPASSPAGNRPSWAFNPRLPMTMVWRERCDRKPQTARFRKQILLPGALSSGKAFIELWDAGARARPRAVKLLVNGRVVAKWRRGMSSQGEPLGPDALKAFRYGANTIELRARRPRLREGAPRCNSPTGEKVGIVAGLSGQASTDIRVGTGPPVKHRKVAFGKPHISELRINVFNDGPATSVEGTFGFAMAVGPYRDIFFVTAEAPAPFGDCTLPRYDNVMVAVRCPWADFPPGGHALIDVKVGAVMHHESQVPANVSSSRWRADWFAAPGIHNWATTSFVGDGIRSDLDFDHTFGYTEVLCFREPPDDPGCESAQR